MSIEHLIAHSLTKQTTQHKNTCNSLFYYVCIHITKGIVLNAASQYHSSLIRSCVMLHESIRYTISIAAALEYLSKQLGLTFSLIWYSLGDL